MFPRTQAGLTLIELMVVVAIVGILASVAVYMYTRNIARARASEVPAIFGELRIKQEQHNLETGNYLSTGADESDRFPATPQPLSSVGVDVSTMPATWQTLRMAPEKSVLYCSYVAMASDVDVVGAAAAGFGFSAPAVNWFYMLADCDLDGRGAPDSRYFARSGVQGQLTENEGR